MQGSRHFASAMAVAIVLVVAAPGTAPAFASTPGAAAAPHVAAATSHTQREIFGFALASSLADPTVGYPSWNFDLLSTVAFFGLHIGTGGRFTGDAGWTTWNSSALTSLVSIAHQHGARVVLTVILQDFSPNTPAMCAGLLSADATVAETVQEVRAKGVDGVNIDYEGLDGSCGTSDPYWAQHALTTFAQKMRAGLGSSYYLSIDTYASAASDGYGFFDVAGLASSVDSFFVMAYDLEYSNYARPPSSCPQFCLGPTSPLGAYYYNDSTVASQYVAAVGAGKVIFGVPYYGRKACVGAVVPNAFPTSSVIADSYLDASTEASDPAVGAGSYTSHRDSYSPGAERWDTWYNTSLGCTRELYWDDATSLGKKYDMVNADKLRGVGIWNLNYGGGARELWSALASHFSACTNVAVTASPASPQFAKPQTVTLTATSTGCSNPLYEFWLLDQAGWRVVQGYSARPTFAWNTTGAPPAAWTFSIWVLAAGSGGSMPSSMGILDADTAIQYRLTPVCSSVTATTSPGPMAIGAVATITGVASGCGNPLYQFWILPPGSTTWLLGQAYSSNPTFHWNTAGAPAGPYKLSVWARDMGSAGLMTTALGNLDTNVIVPTSLVPTCSSVGITSAPASPVGTGAAVTFTGQAAGCPNPQYSFWIQGPGSAGWQAVQAYSSNPTFRWNTTGAAPGTYRIVVWARDAAGSGTVTTPLGRFDAWSLTQSTVFGPCTSATLSASPASPVKVGTGVTVTAKATGCPNPLYEFWMRPASSSTWQMIQAYSSSPTLQWSTAGKPAGGYYLGVWARDASSPGVVSTTGGSADVYMSILTSLVA